MASNKSNQSFRISACRICLDSKYNMVVLDEQNGWLPLFHYCFGFSLTDQDQPRSICKSCAENVKTFAKFKQQCLKSNDIWKSVISDAKCYIEKIIFDNIDDLENISQSNPISNTIQMHDDGLLDDDSNFFNDDGGEIDEINVQNGDDYKKSISFNENDFPIENGKLDTKICSNSNKGNYNKHKNVEPKYPNNQVKIEEKEVYTCKMCKKKYGKRKYYIKHINICKSPKKNYYEKPKIDRGNQYYAYDCGRVYECTTFAVDNKDVAKDKNEFQSLKCDKEESKYVSQNQDDSLFFCGLCKFCCTTNSDVNKHLDEHWSNNDLSCKLCDFVGIDLAAIAAHRFFHYISKQKKRFVCHICNKTTLSLMALHFHYRQIHLKKTGGFCSRCNKEFKKLKGWKKHERAHGPGYICDVCGKRYSHKFLIRNHMVNHFSPGTYICDTCGITFNFARYLNRHIRTVHTKSGPAKCTHCNRMFKSEHTLRVHLKKINANKPIKCEVCSKRYISPAYLKGHMVMHSEERPYCCDICGSRYKAKSQLKVHMRNHTGIFPFKCGVCSKAFATSTQLKVHSSVHTGVRPISCLHCKKTFHSKKLMEAHCALHHKYDKEEQKVTVT